MEGGWGRVRLAEPPSATSRWPEGSNDRPRRPRQDRRQNHDPHRIPSGRRRAARDHRLPTRKPCSVGPSSWNVNPPARTTSPSVSQNDQRR